MSNLQSLLFCELDSLQNKMYKCKTVHLRYSMLPEHKYFLLRQSVLGIYAEWEGFIKKAIALYLQEINKMRLPFSTLHDYYISYQTDNVAKFKSPKTNFGAIAKLSRSLFEMYQGPVVFSTGVNTESNANLKVTNSILDKLCLKCLSPNYEGPLNKLLKFRNSIAHGDEGIPVTQSDIDSFSLLVQDLATDFALSVNEGFESKVYLSHNNAMHATSA
ncbi:MAE_28990/MAE_18760 family HEPN-like nuclease [Thiohalobacter thiocyanaticus]|uniref:MAE_28990/MAE_18760 family HEPN-like nuclease n=1 Tax=Thiohalobacter thiocyanaticus TaxID=585455 RepID=UPI000F63C5F1|nr:MAE_28990/MAE_18760 family HEPN-like nuclease [Thiohalobacter thiocyanaticus]